MTVTETAPSAFDSPGPIEAAGISLVSWLTAVAGPTMQTPPTDAEAPDAGLSTWPLELVAEQSVAGQGRSIRVAVRHLVTGVGTPQHALRMLDRALVAATAAGDVPKVVLAPIALEVWLALRARPRPALLFDVAAQVSAPAVVEHLVRSPLVLHATPMRAISGRVLGPGDVPLAGIRIEVAGLGVRTYSGVAGAFVLAGVPSHTPLRLLMSGRGRRGIADLPADGASDGIVVPFEIEES